MFDGNDCVSDVPEILPPGEHSFLFVNRTDSKLTLWIALLPDDISYDDLLGKQPKPGEYFSSDDLLDKRSELGNYFLAPYDLRQPTKLADSWNNSTEERSYTFLFYEEGEYSHALAGLDLDALWFCGSFNVAADQANE